MYLLNGNLFVENRLTTVGVDDRHVGVSARMTADLSHYLTISKSLV